MVMDMIALKRRLESAVASWDRRNKSLHAGAIALLRLDEAMAEIAGGADVTATLSDCFNGRLLALLLQEARPPLGAADLRGTRHADYPAARRW
jgi:hypothetical protein